MQRNCNMLSPMYETGRKKKKLRLKMGMRPLRVNQRIMPGSKVGTGLSTINDSSDAHAIVAKPEWIRAKRAAVRTQP